MRPNPAANFLRNARSRTGAAHETQLNSCPFREPPGVGSCREFADPDTLARDLIHTLTRFGQRFYDCPVDAAPRKPLTHHSIGVVSRRTGLKPDVIRAWERRYGAITPYRTGTNRRLYTDEDVERLILLRQATLSGRQIGQIGGLLTEELRELVSLDQEAIANAPRPVRHREPRAENGGSLLAAALAAVEALDGQELQYSLERAMVELTQRKMIEELIVPLLVQIGDRWEHGTLRVTHEHLASAVISSLLTNIQATAVAADKAPAILVASPVRQFHELGGLMAAAAAASEGWKVTYLGANLPAEEIAAAALQKGAGVIALSIVYPADDPHLERELTRLRRMLGDGPHLIAGGRAAPSYRPVLDAISGHLVEDIQSFRSALRRLRV